MKTGIWTTNNKKSSQELYDYLIYLNQANKDVEVDFEYSIKKLRPIRSVNANSYYWVILQAIGAKTGDTTDDLHEFFKKKFNSKDVHGEIVGMTTSNLDSEEFSIYVKKVKQFAKDFFGVNVPSPEDRYYKVWEKESKNIYNAMFNAI